MRIKILTSLVTLFCLNAWSQTNKIYNFPTEIRSLSERWELDSTIVKSTFIITPYKPFYIMPFNISTNRNNAPFSGNGKEEYVAEKTPLNDIEAKFQISFKTKIFQNLLFGKGDLWIAYTQLSNWQIYNEPQSRPFRELNYEPELIFNYPLNLDVFGVKLKMAGVSFNHQSNGKSLPYSRSWNRIIFHAGMEVGDFTIIARPWLRMRATKDDNPDIAKYIGRGDLTVVYVKNENIFTFIGSHNLNFTKNSRGFANFTWSYPISGNLRGYAQLTTGYGESMIDYNHRQTTFGIGISLLEWL